MTPTGAGAPDTGRNTVTGICPTSARSSLSPARSASSCQTPPPIASKANAPRTGSRGRGAFDPLVRLFELEFRPAGGKRADQVLYISVAVDRRWRDPKPLGAARYGRIVDRLRVYAVMLEQHVAHPLAADRAADHHRNDVARVPHVRDARRVQPAPDHGDPLLLPL